MLEEENLSAIVCRELKIDAKEADMSDWEEMVARIHSRRREVRIGIVGKYVRLHDAYLSVAESLMHAGFENDAVVKIAWIDSEEITEESVAGLLGGWTESSCRGDSGCAVSMGKTARLSSPGKRYSLSRHLSGDADCRDRVRPERARKGKCEFQGV